MVLSLLLLVVALLVSSHVQAEEGSLFLVVRNRTNDTEGDCVYQGTTYNLSNNSRCQCITEEGSHSLLHYQDRIETCMTSDLTSTLDICSTLELDDSMYQIEVQSVNTSSTSSRIYKNIGELCERVERVREALSRFESLLTRTLVCVYLSTCKEKTKCLVSSSSPSPS